MKHYLLAVALICFGTLAGHAATPSITGPSSPASPVKSVIPVGTACSSMTLTTSGTAVEVTGNTSVSSTTYGASSVAIWNLDTTNNVFCNQSSGVTASGNLIGVPIAPSAATGPRNFLSFMISTAQKWWCVAGANNVSIQVCLAK